MLTNARINNRESQILDDIFYRLLLILLKTPINALIGCYLLSKLGLQTEKEN